MYAEVKYQSESTKNVTVEIFKMKQDNPTKQDFLNILEESKRVTGVGRKFIDFRLVDSKNNDVVDWMQTVSPCMLGQWIDWSDYRGRMNHFKTKGINPKQIDIDQQIREAR